MKKLSCLMAIAATFVIASCAHNANKEDAQTSSANIDSMVSAAQASVSPDTSNYITDSSQMVKDSTAGKSSQH